MLKDPNVARAILQTLEGSQAGASHPAAAKWLPPIEVFHSELSEHP